MAKRMSKAARKKRTIRVILICIIVLALIVAAIGILRKKVTQQVSQSNRKEVISATVQKGSISTTVSGSGNLADEDVQDITLYKSVEVDEILVEAGDTVAEGDLLATVNMTSVLSAMADIQSQIRQLDEKIADASGDEVEDTVCTMIAGRVMKIYAQKGDDVSTVMYENGALALLSLDGFMEVTLEAENLKVGDVVTVTGSNGTELVGTVDSVSDAVAKILVPDEKAVYGDQVCVALADGTALGTGELSIHEMVKITGIAGTIKDIKVSENQKIKAEKTIFTLTDTSFSANYTSLLEDREELEEQLQQLVCIYHDGAVLAPGAGIISSIADETSSSSQQSGNSGFGASQDAAAGAEQVLLSICPGTKMTVDISVDEMDILSLAAGQAAVVSVDALGDETVAGTVSQISTTATSSGGVTVYTVTISMEKQEKMLSGMSASVSIVIKGVEDALLIPSSALTQTSAKSYVYTSYNTETGELSGMVEVIAGMDNGNYVEITSGLAQDDTVYYYENQEQSYGFGGFGGNRGENIPGGFGGGGFGGGDFGGDFGGFGGSGGSGGFGGNRPGRTEERGK